MTTEPIQPTQPATPAPAAPAPVQPQPLPPDTDPEFVQFQAQLQRYLGFGVSDLVGSIQTVQQLAAEREASLLRQQWGDQYQDNFAAVQSRLQELYQTNPQLANSLNNAQGAQLVWAQIQQERQAAAPPQPSVPGFPRSATPSQPGGQRQALFKRSEIEAMDVNTRRIRHNEIVAAYANNLVSPD